jgi:hypothetical protein
MTGMSILGGGGKAIDIKGRECLEVEEVHVRFLPVVDYVVCDSAHFEPPRVRRIRTGVHAPTTWFGEFIVKIYRVHEFYSQKDTTVSIQRSYRHRYQVADD